MEVQDIHVGHQLHVSASTDGGVVPYLPNLRDPVCLGAVGKSIGGSIFANGLVLVGNPMSYPSIPEAAVMISRPSAKSNPAASAVPSLLKVTTKANIPTTPLDIMFGDPGVGMVEILLILRQLILLSQLLLILLLPQLILLVLKIM